MKVEVHTPHGRANIILSFLRKIYLIGMNLNDSADKAMEQINLKKYSERFALSRKPVVKVGVNFSKETRNITSWFVE